MSHEGIRFVDKDHAGHEQEENRPLPRIAVTPEKVRVLLTEGKGLEIDWVDGHRSAWSFAWLREACPCATCKPAPQACQRPRRRPLRHPVQLARRPHLRHLLMGLPPPRLPVPRMHIRRRRNHRHAELNMAT